MGPFKEYVTCIISFFIPFIWVILYQFYSFTSPVLFTKTNKRNERKEDFLYIWLLQCIMLYKGRKKIPQSLDTIAGPCLYPPSPILPSFDGLVCAFVISEKYLIEKKHIVLF